jgi:hypothetical protein
MLLIMPEFALFSTAGTGIERFLSQARAAFDCMLGGCKAGTRLDQLGSEDSTAGR